MKLCFFSKWMELEIIMLSEISQSHKEKCHVFSQMAWNLGGKHKIMQVKRGQQRI
jgi:hypothetical protein